MTHQLLATLKSAESFISGFEDDPLQEGIPTLLADLRAAIERTEPADPAEIEAARDGYQDDDLEIDDDALVSHADEGYWVSAWVWIAHDDDEVGED